MYGLYNGKDALRDCWVAIASITNPFSHMLPRVGLRASTRMKLVPDLNWQEQQGWRMLRGTLGVDAGASKFTASAFQLRIIAGRLLVAQSDQHRTALLGDFVAALLATWRFAPSVTADG